MNLLDYWRVLRRRWKLIALCVLVAGAAAFVTTPSEPANDNVTYSASHQLIRDTTEEAQPVALATVSLYIRTGEVPGRAAERLDFEGEPALLAARILVEPDEQVGTLTITAKGNSRAQAAERANVFAEETLALLGEQARAEITEATEQVAAEVARLQAEIDLLEGQIEAAEEAEESTAVLESQRNAKLTQFGAALEQQAQLTNQPPPSAGYATLQPALPELAQVEGGGFAAPRSRPARTAIGIVLGLAIGIGGVLVLARLDTRIHDVEDGVRAFELPLVAEIPDVKMRDPFTIISETQPLSAAAEGYRSLRTALLLNAVTELGNGVSTVPGAEAAQEGTAASSRRAQVILVTSPAPSEGKTSTAANLAVAMAETGREVLLMGCDFRRPDVHRFFDLPGSPGIADALEDDGPDFVDVAVRSRDGIYLAPHGKAMKSLGAVARRTRVLVTEARSLVDTIIIDTAPMLATNDAAELIPVADAVVVAFRVGQTTVKDAKRTRFLLERLGASAAGIVAVGTDERETSNYAAYYSTDGVETLSDRVPMNGSKQSDRAAEDETTGASDPSTLRES